MASTFYSLPHPPALIEAIDGSHHLTIAKSVLSTCHQDFFRAHSNRTLSAALPAMNTAQVTTTAPCDESDIVTATRSCDTDPSSLDHQVIEGFPPLPDETGDEEESLSGSTLNNDDTDDGDGDTAAVDPASTEICKRAANLDGLSEIGGPSSPLTDLDGSFKFRRNSDPTSNIDDDLEPERTHSPPPRNAKPERLKGILRTPSVSFPGTDGSKVKSKDVAQLIAESRAQGLARSLQEDSSVSGEESEAEEESVCTVLTEPAQAA